MMLMIDMDMPESCYNCPLEYDRQYCPVDSGPPPWDQCDRKSWDFTKERHPDCPLHETDDFELALRVLGIDEKELIDNFARKLSSVISSTLFKEK